MKVLLVTPPFIQTNAPYPATAYLTRFLKDQNIDVKQIDLSLQLHLKIFSSAGLRQIRDELFKSKKKKLPKPVMFFLQSFDFYQETVDQVIGFLQGRNDSLAEQIASRSFLPEGARFQQLNEYGDQVFSALGEVSVVDFAQHVASLYLDDIYDAIRFGIDADFGFSSYAESLASSQVSFAPLRKKLRGKNSLIDQMMIELLTERVNQFQPDVVGFTVPFAGNFYSALKLSDFIKKKYTQVTTVMGGGFVNTELRSLSDPRVFDSVDFLIYDDGEKPLELLLKFLKKEIPAEKLLRTTYRQKNKIIRQSDPSAHDVAFKGLKAPDFRDLSAGQYFSMMEIPNPMRRMWTGFYWNKMILAHGCYWKKCSFCDVTLDYIGRFEPQRAENIVDQIEEVIQQTGCSGFHFVDEAAPPALLKQMSKELLRRNLKITWWGNLRFDSQFDEELVSLMAKAGCVAVTGGLEVASPRLLSLINKGLTIEQVAHVTSRFKRHGIFVHAYLMYGFPSQTEAETVDSLEIVRQLFLNKCIDSGFWHRFMATVHSPVGKNPAQFGIKLKPFKTPKEGKFAEYSIPFRDQQKCDHDILGVGLNKAIYNYMHGIGIEQKVEVWFTEKGQKVPRTKIPKTYIENLLKLLHA